MWLSVDPKANKFPNLSPYNFVYNNPISVLDPDGEEGIVVSGSPGNHNNKEHFLINGLYKAQAAKNHTQRGGETITWIIYNDPTEGAGHNPEMLADYRRKAADAGINVIVTSDVDDITTYVNDKNGNRDDDKISSFYYVGHATPGDLDVGYSGTGEDFDPSDLNADAFASGCHVNLVGGCRTAEPGVIEDSNVTQFQKIVDEKSKVYGSDVRVQYNGGIITDENLVKENNGTIVTRNGNLEP